MSAIQLHRTADERVFRNAEELPESLLDHLRPLDPPTGVLLCPPDHFRVVDVKNPFMEGQIGKVDRRKARRQWDRLKQVLTGLDLRVEAVTPLPDCEDMVFAANQTFVGLDESGRRLCVPSRMRHPSRRREVPVFANWFRREGYQVVDLADEDEFFEGGGDAIWHPGRGLIWGGAGPRSQPSIYPRLAKTFGVPALLLELATERFYHLDTCFCPLDEFTALIHPPAFSPRSLKLIRSVFAHVIETTPQEAETAMACNAAVFPQRRVVIQQGAPRIKRELEAARFEVTEVETGEFLKSGGSVFCMKMSFWE